MKSEDLIRAIGLADDKYVLEAKKPAKIKKHRRIITSVAAACITLILVNLWLFLPIQPPPYIAAFAGSEYYPIIERLYLNTEAKKYGLPYSNNFEKLLYKANQSTNMPSSGTDGTTDSYGGTTLGSPTDPNYIETTDNQNEGVIESDRIKRSDKYVYYVQNNQLMVYSLQGESYTLEGAVWLKTYNTEIFLSLDCRYITAISQFSKKTHICVLDVSDPQNIVQVSEITIDSSYLEARYLGDRLVIAAQSNIDFSKKEYSDPSTFVPRLEYNGKTKIISMDDIHITSYEYSEYKNYTTLYVLDPVTLEPKSSFALLGGSETIYFSEDNVFTVANYDKDGTDYCEISCVSYTDGELEFRCAVEALGHVENRRWMDELDGKLRVFADTNTVFNGKDNKSATLSIIDLKKKKVISTVENFAPSEETIQSVRFEKDKAYVCTAIVVELTDPVFFFDLSDYKNISYTDTGTIPGYSLSLIDYKNGDLLGIGLGENRTFKLELYREENTQVVSKSKLEYRSAILSEYKAYFIDRDRKLFGCELMLAKENVYVLWEIKDGEIVEVFKEQTHIENYSPNTRALLTDGYLYIFSDRGVFVHQFENN